MSQKTVHFCFFSDVRQISTNFNFWYVGGKFSEILCCVCFATSPDPCRHTTLLTADVPNFYPTLDLLQLYCSDLVNQFNRVHQIHAIFKFVIQNSLPSE